MPGSQARPGPGEGAEEAGWRRSPALAGEAGTQHSEALAHSALPGQENVVTFHCQLPQENEQQLDFTSLYFKFLLILME